MSLKVNWLDSIRFLSLAGAAKSTLRLSLFGVIIYIGCQFIGCQSRVHERDFQNSSASRDIKGEIKASGQASERIEDAQRFILKIRDIIGKLKGSVPVAMNIGLLDDMNAAIEQSSQSLYHFENELIMFSGEIASPDPQIGSSLCTQHRYSIKYRVPEDKLEIVIFHCDSVIQKTVLSSSAAENQIRIADEPVNEQGEFSKLVFSCESSASRQISCHNIVLGSGVGSRWYLGFSREGLLTQVKVDEIEEDGGAIRTHLGFKISSEGVVTKDPPP